MDPYLLVIILKPTKKQSEEGVSPKIIVEPVCVLATDQGQAIAKGLRKVPDEYLDREDLLEVRVLPFQRACK